MRQNSTQTNYYHHLFYFAGRGDVQNGVMFYDINFILVQHHVRISMDYKVAF